jgi:hypothetical protein
MRRAEKKLGVRRYFIMAGNPNTSAASAPTQRILEVHDRESIDGQRYRNRSSEKRFVEFLASSLETRFRALRASRRKDMSNQIAG